MVQLVFEMRHGSIRHFATRFRIRLAESGLASPPEGTVESTWPIDLVLALNRLYVAAPKDLLTDIQLDYLLPLLKEEHFEFNFDGTSEGLQLAHPHLANLIYNEWFPEDRKENTRISHILSVFSHQLKKPDPRERFFILWALRPEVGRVTEDFIRKCVPRLYNLYLLESNNFLNPSGLPGWIALSNWWEGIDLRPNPTTLAIKHLREGSYEAIGTRLICHMLLDRARVRDDPECVEAVVELLKRAWDWYEWPRIVTDLMQLNSHQGLLHRLGVLQIVLSWIDDHPLELEGPMAVINFKGAKWNKISASIKRSLRAAQEDPRWARLCWSAQKKARVTQKATNEFREINEIAIDWCERHPLSPSMIFLVGNALIAKEETARAQTLARRLIEQDNSYVHNNFILEPLLATGSPEWTKPSATWVLANPNHPSRGFVLERLSAYYDLSSAIGEVLIDWLHQNNNDGGWTYVWDAWAKKCPQEPLLQIGIDWLIAHQEHRGWTFVWETLAEVGTINDEFISLTCAWLNSNLHHGGWLHVWERFREMRPGDQRLRNLAARVETLKMIEKALSEGGSLEGVITKKVDGGFLVNIGDTFVEAFLPASHTGASPSDNVDKFIGLRGRFAVLRYNHATTNIVVSRKVQFEREGDPLKAELLKVLEEGLLLEGEVKNVTDYGAFIDLGGLDGLLHMTEMSWRRIAHPSEVVKVGDHVKVVVIKIDRKRERVFLGMKQITSDPWSFVGTKYLVGSRVEGSVTRITDFGAFAELEPGIHGLIHVSEMTWSKKKPHPSEVFHVGQAIQSEILSIDVAKRRIALGLKQLMPNPWNNIQQAYPIGTQVEGRVTNITNFGAFVELDSDVDGLIHVTEMSWDRLIMHPSQMVEVGKKIRARVIRMDSERQQLSLSIKQLYDWVRPDPWITVADRHPVGSRARGVARFAIGGRIFIELEPGLTGHVSFPSEARAELARNIAIGDEVNVVVIEIDQSRTRLCLDLIDSPLEGGG